MRPPGPGPLRLEIATPGNLTGQLTNGSLTFYDARNRLSLTYAGLRVYDAAGQAIPAWFELENQTSPAKIVIAVNDRAARYPLTIDPLAQQAYLKASNTGAGDNFGNAVALSGDTVVVGANGEASNATGVNGNQADNSAGNAGAAYVFLVPSAEMAVLGNSQVITAGDTTPSATEDTDFGNTLLGSAITRTFTISNSGTADLNLTGSPVVSITGAAAGDFSVVSLPATPIISNTTTTFQVRFNPSIVGTRAATVTIANNDSNENPYNFAIRGTASTGGTTLYLPLIFNETFPSQTINSAAIPSRPAAFTGEVFYTTSLTIPSLPPGGTFYLSANPTPTQVYDRVSIHLAGVEVFGYTYGNPAQVIPALVTVPRPVMEQIAGQTVTLKFSDVFGGQVNATPMYLIWVP